MDIANLSADLSVVRAHLELFAFLLLAVPPISFLTIKFWLTASAASKVQHSTEWVVPRELDSDGDRSLFESKPAVAFSIHQIESQRRHAAAMKTARIKRSA